MESGAINKLVDALLEDTEKKYDNKLILTILKCIYIATTKKKITKNMVAAFE